MSKWLVRCDATHKSGLGHLVRCLGLVEALEDFGHEVCFLGHIDEEFYEFLGCREILRAVNETGTIEDARDTAACAKKVVAKGIVADSYQITGETWSNEVSARTMAPVLFDDFADRDEYGSCGGIINFTVGASEGLYRELASERLFIGPQFFPVRRELARQRSRTKGPSPGDVQRLMVCLGASVAKEFLEGLLAVLGAIDWNGRVRVVVGKEHIGSLRIPGDEGESFPVSSSLAPHYSWADACLVGGGLMKYECAFLGIPCMIASLNDGQQRETDQFVGLGLGWDIGGLDRRAGWRSAIEEFLGDPSLRATIIERGLGCFPENPARNLAKRLIELSV